MVDLSDQIKTSIRTAIAKCSDENEGVDFGFSFAPMADENGQSMICSIFILRMRSHILGEFLSNGFFLNTPLPTPEQIEEYVGRTVEGLRQARDEQATKTIASAKNDRNDPGPGALDLSDILPRI